MSVYREKKVKSLSTLLKMIENLDPDEGIRIKGSVKGFLKGGFIFVTKTGSKYCINITDQIFDEESTSYVPGGKETWMYADTVSQAFKIVKERMKVPLEAWSY